MISSMFWLFPMSDVILMFQFMKKTVLGDPEKEEDEVYKDDAEHWVLDPQLSKRHK